MARHVGPYELGEILGEGGMGVVHAALDPRTGTEVAIKLLRGGLTSGEARARFEREARLGMQVSHPALVPTLDVGVHREGGLEVPWLVMPKVTGRTLRALLDEEGRQDEAVVRHIALQVAAALGALHEVGAVHRDVKPGNVMVTPDDEVLLMDLGVVHEKAEALTRTGQFVGSLLYAAPEVLAGAAVATPGSDLWSLGVLLWELLTGSHPFRRERMDATLEAILHGRPDPAVLQAAGVSTFFQAFVDALLQRQGEVRFASAKETGDALAAGESGTWWRDRERKGAGPTWAEGLDRSLRLAGRSEDLAWLQAAQSEADRRVICLEGEPGSGRTRLVHEWARTLQGWRIIRVSLSGEMAGSWIGRVLQAHGNAELVRRRAAEVAGGADLGARARAVLEGAAENALADLGSGRVDAVAAACLASLGAERPLLLWLEDLEDATPDVIRTLVQVLPDVARGAIQVVLTSTAGDGLSALRSRVQMRRRELRDLTPDEVWEVLRDRFGADHIADDLAPPAHAWSGGRPGFLAAWVDRLRDGGHVQEDASGIHRLVISREALAAWPPPASLAAWWRTRVRQLASEDRELVEAAACSGMAFDPSSVAAVMGRPPLAVLQGLARVQHRSGLVRFEAGRYVFASRAAHAEVLDDLLMPLREAWHRAWAAHLTASPPDGDALRGAWHLALCRHGLDGARPASAIQHALPAGRYLSRQNAPEAECRLQDRFLAASVTLPTTVIGPLAFERVVSGIRVGSLPDEDALERWRAQAADAHDAVPLAYLELALGYRAACQGRYDDARPWLEQAAARALEGDDVDLIVRTHHALGEVLVHRGAFQEGIERLDRALARCHGVAGQEAAPIGLLITQSAHWSSLGRFDKSLPLIQAARALADEHHMAMARDIALRIEGAILDRLGRWDEAVAITRRALEGARQARDRRNTATCLFNLADLAVTTGRPADAWRDAHAALDLARDLGIRRVSLLGAITLAVAGAHLGRHGEAERILEEVVGDDPPASDPVLHAHLHFTRSLLAANPEAWDRVRALAEEGLEILGGTGPATWRCRLHLAAGRACDLLGETTAARTHLAQAWELGEDAETEVGWGLLAGAWLDRHDPDGAVSRAARMADWQERLPVAVRMEWAWLRGEAGDAQALDEAQALLQKLLATLPEGEPEAVVGGHWLHRRIDSGTP